MRILLDNETNELNNNYYFYFLPLSVIIIILVYYYKQIDNYINCGDIDIGSSVVITPYNNTNKSLLQKRTWSKNKIYMFDI